jgi:hypothetical protein
VERLRIELPGIGLDLRLIDHVRRAGEASADLEVLQVEAMIACEINGFRHSRLLVSRFRSSQTFATPSDANFGIKGTLATL